MVAPVVFSIHWLKLLSLKLCGPTTRKYCAPPVSVTPVIPVSEDSAQQVAKFPLVARFQEPNSVPGKPELLVQMPAVNPATPVWCSTARSNWVSRRLPVPDTLNPRAWVMLLPPEPEPFTIDPELES